MALSLPAGACLLAVLLLVAGWQELASGEGDTVPRVDCQMNALTTASVETARLGFEHRGRTHTQVQSDLTVTVPDTWLHAKDLTLGEESRGYQVAMRCLLRGDALGPSPTASERAEQAKETAARRAEWRYATPRVTAQGDRITVAYRAFASIKDKGPMRIGPWEIDVGDKAWRVALRPPGTLKGARWEHVGIQLGDLDFSEVSPEPRSIGKGELVWVRDPARRSVDLEVAVDVDPPWQRYFTWSNTWVWLSTAGVVSWWLSASLVLAVAAFRALPRTPSATTRQGGRAPVPARRQVLGRFWGTYDEGPQQAVLHFAVLSAAVVLTLLLLQKAIGLPPLQQALVGMAAGLALVLVARPWSCPGPADACDPRAEPGGPPDPRPRQARAVTVAATGVAGLGVLAVVVLSCLGQWSLAPSPRHRPGYLWLVLLGLTTLWLGLAAMTAWAWRFAREGGLARKSLIRRWDQAPVRWVATVSALLAAAAAVVLSCFWWAQRRDWRRGAWPGERVGVSQGELVGYLGRLPVAGLRWVYTYSWVLAVIALLALLRLRIDARRREAYGGRRVALGPEGPDFLLLAAIFAFVVGLRQVEFARSNVLYAVWFLLIMFSFYVISSVGRRWSVLSGADVYFLSRVFGTDQRRKELLKKAHEYRNRHHEIYLIEHGRANGEPTREQLEEDLTAQGAWLSGRSRGAHRPAEHYSVVDLALAWGPEFNWWDNARHAARLAFLFGIPATVSLVWLDRIPDYQHWLSVLHEQSGLLEIVAKLCAWQLAWAGAGMALGALWRVLPGRHSPFRALSLTLAYALPVGVGALLSRIADTEAGYALLHVLLMLTVLTLTSLWMDMATFSGERQFWPTRFGLLLSIYQMRGISVQIAYVLAQVAAAVAIWRDLAGS
ncbi:DUF6185 family protein [Streptomyces sp. NPDC090022]|uniref:DUF6185 family protein n=1 Tax=Streptomyces sp. NPDC090022 TaxID=3365920 RepID=UPI003826020B